MRLTDLDDWDVLKPTEAALVARCAPHEISAACENGVLKAEDRGRGVRRHWRIQWSDLRQWIADGRPIEPKAA